MTSSLCDDVDIHDSQFVVDPFPTYRRLRGECPVAHGSRHGGFTLLTRYADVREAARDWRTYTSSVIGVTAIPVITPRSEPQLPIEVDPPEHSTYRALINPVFAMGRVERLRPRIHAIARQLAQACSRKPSADLVRDYAVPLSVGTLAEFTGLPPKDSRRWVAWITLMFDVRDREAGARASRQFGEYIDELIAARRRRPRNDFLSVLMEAQVDGRKLTDHELHSFCTVVFGAGFETTADAMSLALQYLAEQPDTRRLIRDQPELIPSAVEEFLRYGTPIQIFGRNATRDIEIHGATIPAGRIVALCFASANRDESVFRTPERLVVERSPNPHLTFGAGPHQCVGSSVARLELAITLELFTQDMPEFRLDPAAASIWKARGDRRGLRSLPVVFGTS